MSHIIYIRIKRSLAVTLMLGVMAIVASVVFAQGPLSVVLPQDIFLQGNYVEVGMSQNGYFGTSADAPAGYHPINRTTLGFVADFQKDGWTNGSPAQSGDYFLPGSPEQGFTVKWGGVASSNNGSDPVDIPALVSRKVSSGTTESALWVGKIDRGSEILLITKTVTVNANDVFFTINVQMTNVGTATISSLKYLENVDPDNDVDLPDGSYATDNYIYFQPGVDGNTNKAMVVAAGTVYTNVVVGLGTVDDRARVSMGGFSNRDPDIVWSAPATCSGGPCAPSPGTHRQADEAISLAYNLGDLAPGASTDFSYVYSLSESALGEALSSLSSFDKTVTPSADVPYHGVVTYTLTLKNSGNVTDTNAIVTDTLPTAVNFGSWIEKPAGASVNSDQLTWTGTLSVGAVITFTFTANHVGNYGDVVTNTAEYSTTSTARAIFTVVDAPPIAGLSITHNSPVMLGQPMNFTATTTAGGGISYTWDFGDSNNGAGATVSHTYSVVGTYTPTVTATNTTSVMTATATVDVLPWYIYYFPVVAKNGTFGSAVLP